MLQALNRSSNSDRHFNSHIHGRVKNLQPKKVHNNMCKSLDWLDQFLCNPDKLVLMQTVVCWQLDQIMIKQSRSEENLYFFARILLKNIYVLLSIFRRTTTNW